MVLNKTAGLKLRYKKLIKIVIRLEFDQEKVDDSDVYNYLSDLMLNDALAYETEDNND